MGDKDYKMNKPSKLFFGGVLRAIFIFKRKNQSFTPRTR